MGAVCKTRRIGIGFFGLPRASDICYPSIQEKLVNAASRLGDVSIRYHCYQQDRVLNPSTHENAPLELSNYAPFNELQGVLESPAGIPELRGFETIKSFGDAWTNDFVSLRNLLLQLHSLDHVTRQLIQVDPDIVVFARPDLLYHDDFEGVLTAALADDGSVARLPAWQWCGGYNDRFSIVGRYAISAYGSRIEAIGRYLEHLDKPLHAERLLQFALDAAAIKVRPVTLRASRVRVGGVIRQEKFDRAAIFRRIRWKLRETLKTLVLCV